MAEIATGDLPHTARQSMRPTRWCCAPASRA